MGKILRLVNGEPRMVSLAVTDTSIYAAELTVTGSNITAGTAVTLPSSGTYNADELQIYLNGIQVKVTEDYSYVGSVPRTQIQFLYDLIVGDTVEFHREWAPQ